MKEMIDPDVRTVEDGRPESDWCRLGHSSWGRYAPEVAEEHFLRGPGKRFRDLRRALHIFFEFTRGFRTFSSLPPTVTVFGSARFGEETPYYGLARALARRLAEEGFAVMTGGGPGIMEAANRGASEVGGTSVGCNITLPSEQRPNPYVDPWIEFRHFFVRKVMLVKYSYAFVALPGGGRDAGRDVRDRDARTDGQGPGLPADSDGRRLLEALARRARIHAAGPRSDRRRGRGRLYSGMRAAKVRNRRLPQRGATAEPVMRRHVPCRAGDQGDR